MRRVAFWAALVAAAGAACRQLVGISDKPPMETVDAGSVKPDAAAEGGPACGLAYEPSSCEECLDMHCCAQLGACSGIQACASFETCAAACSGDAGCRAQCFQSQRPVTDPSVVAVESCLVEFCHLECGANCGGVAEFATPDAAAACQQCFGAQACQSAVDCLGNGECATQVFCSLSAPTLDTQAACMSAIDSGLDGSAAAFATAAQNQCLEACGLDANWSCVGHVQSPPPVQGGMTLQFSLFNIITPQQLLPGVTAKLCEVEDTSCAHPGAQAQSDSNGNVTIVVPDGGVGNFYLGYVDLSEGGIEPELVYWSFPISENVARIGSIGTATPDQASGIASTLFDAGWDAAASGIVTVLGRDCYLFAGKGLSYAISPSASPPTAYYLDSEGIMFQPGLTATTKSGYGAFLNVPPGHAMVTAWLPPPAGAIGQFSGFVRPGTITLVMALPTQ